MQDAGTLQKKSVYCNIEPSRKISKFISGLPGMSDIAALKKSFFIACSKDSVLWNVNLMTVGKSVIFQQQDEEGEWCDIEEEDNIKHKSTVKVILFSLNNACSSSNGNFMDSSTQNPSQLNAGDSLRCSVVDDAQILPIEVEEMVSLSLFVISKIVNFFIKWRWGNFSLLFLLLFFLIIINYN